MKLYLCVDPTFENSYACSRILRGIRTEASKRRYAIETIDGMNYASINYDALPEGKPEQILLVGQYSRRLSTMASHFRSRGIHTILVGSYLGHDYLDTSSISMDYPQMTKTALNYLIDSGHNRTALFGIDSNRSTDELIQSSFLRLQHRQGIEMAQHLCFPICSSIEECCESFASHIHEYDSVLCCSDEAAVRLIEYGKTHGFEVPADLFLISYGTGFTISEVYSPTITTVTTHYATMGMQAVQVAALLSKSKTKRSLDMRVSGDLSVRESTANIPFDPNFSSVVSPSAPHYVDISPYRYLHLWTSIGPEKDLDYFGIRLFGRFSHGYSALYLHTRTQIHLEGTRNGLLYTVDLLSNDTNCAAVLPAGFEGHIYIPLDAFVEYDQILLDQPERYPLNNLHNIQLVLPGARNGHRAYWNDIEAVEHLPDAVDKSVGNRYIISCFDRKENPSGETKLSDISVDAPLFRPMISWTVEKTKIDGEERFSLQCIQQWDSDISASFVCGTHYFVDPDRQRIASIEILLSSCNLLDLKIILGLLENHSYATLAEKLYASINTIKYRVNHMIQVLGLHTKSEFVDTLNQALPAEMLETIRRTCANGEGKLPWEDRLL